MTSTASDSPVRRAVHRDCTPADRDTYARAFVSSHAVERWRKQVRDLHPNEAVQAIMAGIRDHAARIRDRSPSTGEKVRFDVDIEPPDGAPWWIARLVHDTERGRLAVETVLAHREQWDPWRPPDATAPTGLWLTVLTLDQRSEFVREATRDIVTMRRRVLDLVEEHPHRQDARPLWAQPQPGVLLIRSTLPVTASPVGLATQVTHQPWAVPDAPGQWTMSAVCNPTRSSRPNKKNRDARRQAAGQAGRGADNAMTLLRDDADVRAWLDRKLDGTAVTGYRDLGSRMVSGKHHDRNRITERALTVECTVDVHDPEALSAAVTPGLGQGKSWGLGLTLWDPAA